MAILSHLKSLHNVTFVYNVIQKNEKFKNRIFWKVIKITLRIFISYISI